MKKNIDQVLIKIAGRIPLRPQPLELGQDIEITIKGCIVKKEIMDNQDGSVNVCYIVKSFDEGVISD